MRRLRSKLLSGILVFASILVVAAKKVFDYAAAPDKEKESDFIFPSNSDQVKPGVLFAEPKSPPVTFEQRGGFTNDASHLNKTAIYGIVHVANEDDIRNALQFARDNRLKVTCAGQQHSMGGQTFTHGGLVLDLRDFNRIRLDKDHKRVNIQTGARWWQLQRLLDQEGLSVKAMQSINIFSVGGTLSVNAHGIDPWPGPVSPTVRSMRIMLSSGEIMQAGPSENAELFSHALGGYGLFGVILDVDLDIVDNEMYSREISYMDFRQYPAYYKANVEGNHEVGLVYGRLSVSPRTFLRETAIQIYARTKFDGALPTMEPARHDSLDRFIINFSKTGGVGRWLRWTMERYAEPRLHNCVTRNQAMNQKEACLVTRNEEMYDDMAYLKNRLRDTDILQEYFVPYDRMPEFVDGLRDVVQRNRANLLNVTIRTVHKDEVTALPYATQDMFGFVLYFNVKFNERDNEILRRTTTDLIDVAEGAGGTFYLPYQLFYSRGQLQKSYPNIDAFFAAKKKYDPTGLFANKFYEKYGT
ncbi:MAG TPA: FAD-binding oxidoreductase [Candidatus Acidoferrales bacterium]|nr:FAD-binding oxidoreductase [Candidatus Acidoferrales bacterium]